MHIPHPKTSLTFIKDGEQQITHVDFNNFADGDTHCLITEPDGIDGSDILIKHYLYPNQNEQIVRLLFLLHTLKKMGANSIQVFAPYLPYARQDKAHMPGEAISSDILCELLSTNGCNTLHTIDCHFMKGETTALRAGLKINNVLVQPMLIKRLEEFARQPYHIIGPDDGSSYLASGQTMKKARAQNYEHANDGSIRRAVELMEDKHLSIEVDTVVVADDMVSTGSTMIKALQSLRERGISKLYAMTTHGLFLHGSLDKINVVASQVFYTDTIALKGSVPVVDAVFADLTKKYL